MRIVAEVKAKEPVTMWFCFIMGVVFIITSTISSRYLGDLILDPLRLTSPTRWHTFITYSLIHVNFSHLIKNILLLLFMGFFIEPYIKKKNILKMIIGATIIGTIVYAILSLLIFESSVLAGPNFALYAYAGCFFSFVYYNRRTASLLVILLAVYLVILMAPMVLSIIINQRNLPFSLSLTFMLLLAAFNSKKVFQPNKAL